MISHLQQVVIHVSNPYLYCYLLLGALVLELPWKIGLKNSASFKKHFQHNKYVWWMHGTLTFSLMWLCQPKNLEPLFGHLGFTNLAVLQQGMLLLLAIILWDFGQGHEAASIVKKILINCHHFGLFLAMLLGSGWDIGSFMHGDETVKSNFSRQTSLDTCMFGWLWMIHSFGFLLQVVLPLLGIKVKEGGRSLLVTTLKHTYACGSVYFFYQYMNFNLDKFFTYQTCSLFLMLLGRFFINNNWKNVEFMRRIEFPGFWIVLFDRCLGFHDSFCQRSFAFTISLCGAFILYTVFFKNLMETPTCYVGPKDNEVLKKFLEEETEKVRGELLASSIQDASKTKWEHMRSFCAKWWEDFTAPEEGKNLKEMYPVHDIVTTCQPGDQNDAERLTNLLDKIGDKAVDQQIKDLYDCTAIQFAAHMGYPYECTLVLLKRGANPYIKDSNGSCAVSSGLQNHGNSVIKPSTLGYSARFWERFHKISLEKSPQKKITRKEKLLKIIKSF